MGNKGRVSWGEHLAHRRRDSQSGHSLVARLPHLERVWRSNKEGGTHDKRYHRDDAPCCIRCSPCHVVFHSVVCARLLLEWGTWFRGWSLHADNIQVTSTQMTTRVGLDATCYSNPDDDTCRVGYSIGMTLELP